MCDPQQLTLNIQVQLLSKQDLKITDTASHKPKHLRQIKLYKKNFFCVDKLFKNLGEHIFTTFFFSV